MRPVSPSLCSSVGHQWRMPRVVRRLSMFLPWRIGNRVGDSSQKRQLVLGQRATTLFPGLIGTKSPSENIDSQQLIIASHLLMTRSVIPNMKVIPLGKLVRCWQRKISVTWSHVLSLEEGPWTVCDWYTRKKVSPDSTLGAPIWF